MKADFSCQENKRIKIKTKTKTNFLILKTITHIECNGYVSTVNTIDKGAFVVSRLLKSFETELADYGFLRANRSIIVNLAHVEGYRSGKNRSLELVNDIKVNISRRRVYIFRDC